MALALLASAGRAEIAAGLDAQGVDPRTAVENKYGLDIRDELGRPVTSAKVLSDLKGAAVKRAADNAFTSSLPKARAILSSLELLADAAAAFRLAVAAINWTELVPGLPGGRPKVAVLWLLVLASAGLTTAFCRRPDLRTAASRSRQSSVQVLRC